MGSREGSVRRGYSPLAPGLLQGGGGGQRWTTGACGTRTTAAGRVQGPEPGGSGTVGDSGDQPRGNVGARRWRCWLGKFTSPPTNPASRKEASQRTFYAPTAVDFGAFPNSLHSSLRHWGVCVRGDVSGARRGAAEPCAHQSDATKQLG